MLSPPFRYLGILAGANPRREETWDPIIDKIKKKLNGWNSKLLSRARRLMLINLVLNNLPLYYLRLFKMPTRVAKRSFLYNVIFSGVVKMVGELFL